MHLNIRIPKKVLVLLLVLIVAVLGGVYYSRQTDKNPLPSNIRGVVSYKVIYPSSTKQIDSKSFNYQTDKKTLSFKVNTKTVMLYSLNKPRQMHLVLIRKRITRRWEFILMHNLKLASDKWP
jgi:uncharacterized protein YxeA